MLTSCGIFGASRRHLEFSKTYELLIKMSKVFEKQHLLSRQLDGSENCLYGACASSHISKEGSENVDKLAQEHCSASKEAKEPLTWSQKKLLLGLVLMSLLNGSLGAVMIPFFPVEAASRGVSQVTISAVFSCFALAQMVVSPVVGRVAPVVGVTRLYNAGIATAGVTTVVFGALYHISDTRLFVRGSNLTDQDARRHSSPLKDLVPLPGRSFHVGLRISF